MRRTNGQTWGLCTFGDATGGAFAWKTAPANATVGSSATVNVPVIDIDIKAMVDYLAAHGYINPNPTVTNLSDGWEICSTGGTAETFKVNGYTLHEN